MVAPDPDEALMRPHKPQRCHASWGFSLKKRGVKSYHTEHVTSVMCMESESERDRAAVATSSWRPEVGGSAQLES